MHAINKKHFCYYFTITFSSASIEDDTSAALFTLCEHNGTHLTIANIEKIIDVVSVVG